MANQSYILEAHKHAGKTLEIHSIPKSNPNAEFFYIDNPPIYLDPYWVDKIYTGVVNPTPIPASTPVTSLKPIFYRKGDTVKIKSNIDLSKSYSDYYKPNGSGAHFVDDLKYLGGAIATLKSDTPKSNNYADLVLEISGNTYYADNFWVEPYIVSQTTILSPKPAQNLSISVKEAVVETWMPKSFAFCDACSGHGKHKLGCPPKSLIRSKAF